MAETRDAVGRDSARILGRSHHITVTFTPIRDITVIAELTPQPHTRSPGPPALDAIRKWVAVLEAAADPGWHVRREPNPPYGWNLVNEQDIVVCSGSLDRLEQWLEHVDTMRRLCVEPAWPASQPPFIERVIQRWLKHQNACRQVRFELRPSAG